MVILIHGDDTQAVVTSSDRVVHGYPIIIRIDLKRDGADELIRSLGTNALFADKKAVVVSGITSLKGKTAHKVYQEIMNYNSQKETLVCIVEQSVLSTSILKSFSEAKIEVYKLPKYFFTFLDNLIPKKGKSERELFHKLLAQNAPEQLFYALVNRIRLLLLVSSVYGMESEEVRRMSDWQLQKIKQQTTYWDKSKLINFYKKLYDIEVGMKTSKLPLGLASHLDILISTELN